MEIIEIEKEARTKGEFYTVEQFMQTISQMKGATVNRIDIDSISKRVRMAYGNISNKDDNCQVNWNAKGDCRRGGLRKSKYDLYL